MTDDRRSGPTADRLIDRRAVDDPCSADEQVRSPDRRRVLRTASTLVAGATLAQSLGRAASAQDARPAPAAPAEPLEIAGFERVRVKTSDGTTIQASTSLGKLASSNDKRRPALLLLHGAPQSHVSWHKVAPQFAKNHTVIVPDLRGYGDSSKSPDTPDHAELLEARDGARHGRGDEALRLRLASPSSATIAAAASGSAWRSITRTRSRS